MKRLAFLVFRLGVTVLLGYWIYASVDFETRTVEGSLERSWFPGQVVIRSATTGEERRVPAAMFTEQELEQGRGRVRIPGVIESIRGANLGLLALAGCFPLLFYALGAVRWSRLLAGQGLHLSLRRVLWLCLVGQFFSMALPGLTGGDVIKAYYVTRETHRRAPAVATVVVDRVVGLTALLILAVLTTLLFFRDPNLWFIPWILVGSLACIVMGAVVFFSTWVRRLFRVDQLLGILPFGHLIKKLDEAFLEFRQSKHSVAVALGISLVIHVGVILANYLLGLAVGIRTVPIYYYAALIPIILALSSLPISMGGLGVRESLYGILLGSAGAQVSQAVLISLLFWLSHLVWALPGGVLYALRKETTTAHEMEVSMELAEADPHD